MQHYFIHTGGPRAISFFESNFGILDKTLRLSAYPEDSLREILENVCRRAGQEGKTVHRIHNCLDNSLQGLILPELSAGLFGFMPWDPVEMSLAGLLWPEQVYKVQEHVRKARERFSRARAVHDRQEEIYIGNMDFAAANRIAAETVSRLFGDMAQNKQGYGIHRFFGAATADGNLDYIPELTEDLERRYLIKGRPGTGKSTLLKKVAEAAKERGFRPEIYHCSLDPRSLDMVIVRELGFCILDSTAPHEYFPVRPGDEILDLYGGCVTPGTDEAYAEQLSALLTEYKGLVGKAMESLRAARDAAAECQEQIPPVQPEAVAKAEERIMARIFE